MKKVIHFPEKALIDQEAADWLMRLDADEPLSNDEHIRLVQWMGRSSAHSKRIRELADTWDKMNVLTELAVPLDNAHSAKIHRGRFFVMKRNAAILAASLLLGVGVGAAYFFSGDATQNSNGFYTTAIGEQTTSILADGSVILLNTDSQIRVDYAEGYRDVHLMKGEVFFTVAKDPKMPFRVFTGMGRIDAIGTAFSVYLRDDVVTVTVTAGSVSLASMADFSTNRVSLTEETGQLAGAEKLGVLEAGQAATISRTAGDGDNTVGALRDLHVVEERDMTKRMSWREGVLVFSGEPLHEVVRQISRYTTATIEFSDPEVRSIRIGGRFPVGETEEMFESLERDFGLEVTRMSPNRIVVSAGNPM